MFSMISNTLAPLLFPNTSTAEASDFGRTNPTGARDGLAEQSRAVGGARFGGTNPIAQRAVWQNKADCVIGRERNPAARHSVCMTRTT
jgi:hypothetical protein